MSKFNYDHIIWDWNGTLFNDVDLCVSVVNNLLEKYSLKKITKEEYRERFDFPIENYYREVGFDFSKYTFKQLGREWMDEYEERKYEAGFYHDIIDALNFFRKENIGQSILTAYQLSELGLMLSRLKIENYFEETTGLDNIYAESKIQIGKNLIKKLETKYKSFLLIGDTKHDLEVAAELGIDCVIVSRGHQSKNKLVQNGAIVFESIEEIVSKFLK